MVMMDRPILPKLVGERVKRREDPRLIQGRGTYVDDVKLPGMLHMAFKRSDIAHGTIRSIDVSLKSRMFSLLVFRRCARNAIWRGDSSPDA